jgi:two-component system chemotaxis response regulator CheB
MAPIRVLVVDDSVVIRRLVTDLLTEDPDIEVVGTAVNGRAALHKVEALSPDLITMDIEMPEMNGIEAVAALRSAGCAAPIVMFSTLTEQGAVATLDALAAGATDYVAKPANVGSVGKSMELVRDSLIPRIKTLVPRTFLRPSVVAPTPRTPGSPRPALAQRSATDAYRLLVLGSSTGGPEALHTLFTSLPLLSVPIAVVQHMPPIFTRQFAARLDRSSAWKVTEAEHDQPLAPGQVVIAPGDHHLEVVSTSRGFVAKLHQGPQENYCRPAVDVLFRSAAAAAGAAVLGVVLTGMGSDGERGADAITQRGGSVLAQDQATSVVWGMPGAVTNAGLAELVLPLQKIAPELARRLAVPGRLTAAPRPVEVAG